MEGREGKKERMIEMPTVATQGPWKPSNDQIMEEEREEREREVEEKKRNRRRERPAVATRGLEPSHSFCWFETRLLFLFLPDPW